jgi:hypothetical protein
MQDFLANVDLLKAYVDEHGSFPPRSYKDPTTNALLGRWLAIRRSQFNKGELLPEKVAALTAAFGEDWKDPNNLQLLFDDMYDRVLAYVEAEGTLPTRSTADEDGANLGIWVKNKRAQYRKGTLPAERIEQLEQIPGWAWEHQGTARRSLPFAESIEICKEFVKVHGRQPLYAEPGDDQRLNVGRWVNRQRTRKRDGRLSKEQIKALESIPGWFWEWDPVNKKPIYSEEAQEQQG